MGKLSSLINKFESLGNLNEVIRNSVNRTSEDWAEINREQLLHGINAKGQVTGEYKSPVYAEVKHRINPLAGFGVPDFKVTGAFYDAIFMRAEGGKVITSASDWKLPKLEKSFGVDILGLSPEYKKKYIFGPLYSEIKKEIGF